MMIHPEDIGDFECKRRKEDALTERPEEEADLVLLEEEREAIAADEAWKRFLEREAA